MVDFATADFTTISAQEFIDLFNDASLRIPGNRSKFEAAAEQVWTRFVSKEAAGAWDKFIPLPGHPHPVSKQQREELRELLNDLAENSDVCNKTLVDHYNRHENIKNWTLKPDQIEYPYDSLPDALKNKILSDVRDWAVTLDPAVDPEDHTGGPRRAILIFGHNNRDGLTNIMEKLERENRPYKAAIKAFFSTHKSILADVVSNIPDDMWASWQKVYGDSLEAVIAASSDPEKCAVEIAKRCMSLPLEVLARFIGNMEKTMLASATEKGAQHEAELERLSQMTSTAATMLTDAEAELSAHTAVPGGKIVNKENKTMTRYHKNGDKITAITYFMESGSAVISQEELDPTTHTYKLTQSHVVQGLDGPNVLIDGKKSTMHSQWNAVYTDMKNDFNGESATVRTPLTDRFISGTGPNDLQAVMTADRIRMTI
ncbi:MAG: hypothetical protein II938_00730 [Alphaproteobacteria bacterium]|nr:hypothetical protein [Alphaproteobacteria bacterium]